MKKTISLTEDQVTKTIQAVAAWSGNAKRMKKKAQESGNADLARVFQKDVEIADRVLEKIERAVWED